MISISILQWIERFSGVMAIFIAWFFVVAPALKFGINSKFETITVSTTKSQSVKKLIGCGLIVGAVFQSLFLFYVARKFSISLFDFGSLLYLSANLATVLVAFFTHSRCPKIHSIMVLYYFITLPVSLLFIGISAEPNSRYLLLVSVFAPTLYFAGQVLLFKKYKNYNALMEFWAFFVLSIWTLAATFI